MKLIRMAAALLATAIAAGCGDENGGVNPGSPDLPLSGLVGTWQANAIEVVKVSDPSVRVDLIALGGAATARFEPNRRVAFVATWKGETDAYTGRLSIEGHDLVVSGDGGQPSRRFSCGLSDYAMSLTDAHETYDFDDDGIEEAAKLSVGFERGVNEFAIADVAGTWQAKSWLFTNRADPSEAVDLIALGGAVTATLHGNGRYTMLLTDLDGTTETDTGTLQVVGEYLVPLEDEDMGDPDAFSCALSGDIMTFESSDATYDFDEDGIDDRASFTAVWERN